MTTAKEDDHVHIKVLMPLLEDNPPKATIVHTIHLCKHIEKCFKAELLKERFRNSSADSSSFLNLVEWYRVNFQFCQEFLVKKPELFDITSIGSFKLAFSAWFLTKIFNMISIEKQNCFDQKPLECALSLMRFLSELDRHTLISHLLIDLAALADLNESFIKTSSKPITLLHKIFDTVSIEAIEDGKTIKVCFAPEKIDLQLIECERFQSEICSIFRLCIEYDLFYIPSENVWLIWDCIFRQMKFGGFDLKEKSLNFTIALLQKKLDVEGVLQKMFNLILAQLAWFMKCGQKAEISSVTSLMRSVSNFLDFVSSIVLCDVIPRSESIFRHVTIEVLTGSFLKSIKLTELLITQINNVYYDRNLLVKLCDFSRALCKLLIENDENENFDSDSKTALNLLIYEYLKKIVELQNPKKVEQFGDLLLELCRLYYNLKDEDLDSDSKNDPQNFLIDYVTDQSARIGNVTEVDTIFDNFLLITQLFNDLFKTLKKNIVRDNFIKIITHFAASQSSSLLNGLVYGCKLGDKLIINYLYNLVSSICQICVEFLSKNAIKSPLTPDLIALVSLRWLKKNDFKDLNVANSESVGKLHQSITPFLESESVSKNLQCIAKLSHEFCPQWRTYVFTVLIGSDKATTSIKLALNYFPYLLANCFHEAIPILNEFILSMFQYENLEASVLQELCATVGCCVCILAKCWEIDSGKCKLCNAIEPDYKKAWTVDAKRFLGIVHVLDSEQYNNYEEKMRLDLCQTVLSIVNHCKVDENLAKILTSALVFVADQSIVIRDAFLPCWKFYFKLQTSLNQEITKALTQPLPQESLIKNFGEIAKYASGILFESSVIRLCKFIWNGPSVIGARLCQLASSSLLAVRRHRNLTGDQLMAEFYAQLVRFLTRELILNLHELDAMVDNGNTTSQKSVSSNGCDSVSIEPHLRDAIESKIGLLCVELEFLNQNGTPDLKKWCSFCEKHFVASLMMQHCPEASRVHKAFASVLGTNRNSLIYRNISYILLELASSGVDSEEAGAVFAFVEGQCAKQGERLSLARLVSSDMFKCTAELTTNLARLEANDDVMLDWLHRVLTICDEEKIASGASSAVSTIVLPDQQTSMSRKREATILRDVSRALNAKFFGLLIRFEEKLRFTTNSSQDKTTTVRSFGRFIEICDAKILGDAALKALSILKLSNSLMPQIEHLAPHVLEDYKNALSSTWLQFVVRLPPDAMRRLSLQTLLACSRTSEDAQVCQKAIGHLMAGGGRPLVDFAFLLTNKDRGTALQGWTSDAVKRLDALRENTLSMRQCLTRALQIARGDSADLKMAALKRMLTLLRDQQMDVYRLISEADNIDSVILRLVDFLLITLGHSDVNVKSLAAACFGELGAIDPGLFRSNNGEYLAIEGNENASDNGITGLSSIGLASHHFVFVDLSTTSQGKSEENATGNKLFAVKLLTELCSHLVGSTAGHVYNVFSYALQETLKFFHLNTDQKSVKNSATESIWLSLNSDVRTTLSPLLSTHYVVSKTSSESLTNLRFPIFGCDDTTSFQRWIQKFVGHLVSQLKPQKATQLFEPLSIAALSDVNFARFLLPHIVVQKLREGDETCNEIILKEVKVILDFGTLQYNIGSKDKKFILQVAQEIFLLLDFLNAWILKYRSIAEKLIERKRIENFLNEISQMTIVDCATSCQAYTRALMSYEAYIVDCKQNNSNRDSDDFVQPYLAKLQQLYSHLGDVDSVVGSLEVRKSKRQPSPKEEILALECMGNYSEALPFHELLIASEPEKLENHKALVKCLLKLNQSNLALRYLDGLVKKDAQFEPKTRSYKIETLCKLEDWATLGEELEKTEIVKTWGRDVADLLQTAKKLESGNFLEKLTNIRADTLHRLQTVSLDSSAYDRAYKYVLRLHMISEIENGASSFLNLKLQQQNETETKIKTPNQLIEAWKCRFDNLQASTDVLNCVLETRRQIFSLVPNDSKEKQLADVSVKKIWLQSLRIARKSGHLQSAFSLLAKVKALGLPEAFEEEAKLLWLKGEQDSATICLQRGINEYYPEFLNVKDSSSALDKNISLERKLAFAKAQLRLANYARESASNEFNDITRMYNLAIDACPKFEDAHYYLAVHFDKIESAKKVAANNNDWCQTRQKIITSYGMGLKNGSKFLHHAMPRMLTLWLDAASKLNSQYMQIGTVPIRSGKSSATSGLSNAALAAGEHLKTFNSLMSTFGQTLPVYQLYSSFSQLISRITHPCTQTTQVLKEMIARTILAHPQQCLWMSIGLSKSSVAKRREICDEIFKMVGKKNPTSTAKLIRDFQKLRDLLQSVCFFKEANFRTSCLSMKEKFPELFKLFTDSQFSRIMMPLQSLMDVTLPMPVEGKTPDENFNPFPNQIVYIGSFENLIEVFPTLQRPKKVSMRGSDGKSYSVLCKPKDDLRIDKRVMECATLTNVLLLRCAEARRRQLRTRTYAVVPLSEDFGLLEWVPGLETMRGALLAIYKERGCGVPNDKLKEYCAKTKPDSEKLQIFQQKLLPSFPSVFSQWFRRNFTEPTAWYHARSNYIRSAAVMSVFGFILGLGDRHGENILLDTTQGDVVHVDFNCLFNRGEELEVPELVPFRLTHNMVEAMGPLGYEGPFRKTCEVTMRVLRDEKETVRSVLETFLYDPLVEWRKHDDRIKLQQMQSASNLAAASSTKSAADHAGGECVSDKAQQHVTNIDYRLNGCVALKSSLYGTSLSVEGQVNHLICQATDQRLLSRMYVGWAAYM